MRAFFYRVFSFLFFVCVFSVRSVVLFFCYRSFFSARELQKKKKERKKERN